MELQKIDLLDEQGDHIREIMSRKPMWMIRWGTTLILIVLCLIIFLSWLLKYPDIISAKITITTPIPPARVVARVDGPIRQLLISDQQAVRTGQLLAMIGNPAQLNDVSTLENFLNTSYQLPGDIYRITSSFPQDLTLGVLQPLYNELKEAIEIAQLFVSMQPVGKELAVMDQQRQNYEQLLLELDKQSAILDQEITLAEKEYQRFTRLFKEQSISEQQWEQVKRSFLRTQERRQTLETQKAESIIRINQLTKEVTKLKIEDQEKIKAYTIDLESKWENLKSQISQWKENYLITSPINGKVSLFNFWSEDQLINQGEEFCTIVPTSQQSLIGKMNIPVENAGKAKKGLKVLIHLDSYPSNEYGMIKGEITSISLVPRDRKYAVEVIFPDSLKTTYNLKIPFRQELLGNAEIITKDIRLLDRILFRLKGLIRRYPV